MNGRRGGKGKQGGGSPALPRVYEGAAVLGELLSQAGSKLSVDEVKEVIRDALRDGDAPAEVFDFVFEEGPRFAGPDVALRTYGNLFGLWDRIASGKPEEPVATAEPAKPEAKVRAEAPAPTAERPLTDEFVEAAWRYIADLPDRELERLSHRFENTQPELSEFVRLDAGESEAAIDTADTLAFELWAMLDLAMSGARIRAVRQDEYESAKASEAQPEPALERYLADALEESILDEADPLPREEAERVGAVVRAALRALSAAAR